jgi:mRNA interferase RelE/StbE
VADYSITFARTARKEIQTLDSSVAKRVLSKIEALQKAPRPAGVVKIQGAEHLWRIRIGDWRVIYQVLDGERRVDIVAIRHRSDAYR